MYIEIKLTDRQLTAYPQACLFNFLQVDLRVYKRFPFASEKGTGEVFLQVFNLFDRENFATIEGRATARNFGEGIALAVDSGLAAFRNLTLPFDDRSKIEDVIKFEIESDLPQWDIDDVIVDFLVTDSKPGVQSDLLVTAVPKTHLGPKLEACNRAGLEASEAELDGAALFDVALQTGSGVGVSDVRELRVDFEPYGATEAVRDLDEALAIQL